MIPYFAPLELWELSLLLTTLILQDLSGDDESLRQAATQFAPLPKDSQQRLQQKLTELGNLTAQARQSLLVSSFKTLIESNGLQGLEQIHPSHLLPILQNLPPRAIACLCSGLPKALAAHLLASLPESIRYQLPPPAATESLDKSLSSLIRILVEQQFTPMPYPSSHPMTVWDVVFLSHAELKLLLRDIGFIALGQAFLSVGEQAALDLSRKLPQEDAYALKHVLVESQAVKPIAPQILQAFFANIVGDIDSSDDLICNAGLWHLAIATHNITSQQSAVIGQKLPIDTATKYKKYLEAIATIHAALEQEWVLQVQDQILIKVVLLGETALIKISQNPNLVLPPHFNQPEQAERLLALGRKNRNEPASRLELEF